MSGIYLIPNKPQKTLTSWKHATNLTFKRNKT